MPDGSTVEDLREPIAECHILVPQEYLGNVMTFMCWASWRSERYEIRG